MGQAQPRRAVIPREFIALLKPTRWRAILRETEPRLLRGSMWAFAMNSAGMLLGFVNHAVLARTLGVDGFGLYLYVMGWANLVAMLCAIELPEIAVRYVSAYTATEAWQSLGGFLRRGRQIVGVTTLAVVMVGVLVILWFPGIPEERRLALVAAMAIVPLATLTSLQAGALLGFHRLRESQTPLQVFRPAAFCILLLIAAWWLGQSFDASEAILLQVVATGGAAILSTRLLDRSIPEAVSAATPVYHTREWLKASTHFGAISAAQLVLSTQADVLVIGSLLGTRQAGLYGAAAQLALLVGFGSNAIMLMAQPMIADLFARHQLRRSKVIRQIVVMGLVASGPLSLGLIIGGRFLLGVYGEQFLSVYPILLVLAVAQLAAASVGSLLGYLFTMTNQQGLAMRIIGMCALVKVVCAAILISWLGALGAAIATAIGVLLRGFLLGVTAQKVVTDGPSGGTATS